MKKLIALISTEGKTKEQIKREFKEQLKKKGFIKEKVESEVVFLPKWDKSKNKK